MPLFFKYSKFHKPFCSIFLHLNTHNNCIEHIYKIKDNITPYAPIYLPNNKERGICKIIPASAIPVATCIFPFRLIMCHLNSSNNKSQHKLQQKLSYEMAHEQNFQSKNGKLEMMLIQSRHKQKLTVSKSSAF